MSYTVNVEESTFPSATRALYEVVEMLGADQFMELIGHGILDCIKPGYQYIWQEALEKIIAEESERLDNLQEAIDEIDAEREAEKQYQITHSKRG